MAISNPDRIPSAADLMANGAETYRQRNKLYGDNYKRFGAIMMALFPNGIELRTDDDFRRCGTINMIVSKLSRYANDFSSPHIDSIHDMGVYCFMQEELDLLSLAKNLVEPVSHLFWHGGGRIHDRDNPLSKTPLEHPGWYFWQEDWATYTGPFWQREGAEKAMALYIESISPADSSCQHVWYKDIGTTEIETNAASLSCIHCGIKKEGKR